MSSWSLISVQQLLPNKNIVRAYLNAEYWIKNPQAFFFRIGILSKTLNSWVKQRQIGSFVFITAVNPASLKRSSVYNFYKNSELKLCLTGSGNIIHEGHSLDPKGRWEREDSFLIEDASLEFGCELAMRYGQNAFVYWQEGVVPTLVWIHEKEIFFFKME